MTTAPSPPAKLPGNWLLEGDALDVCRAIASGNVRDLAPATRFDLVYLDPPYASALYEPLVALAGARLIEEDGVVVAEHFHKRALPERIGPLARTRQKRIGDHCLSFYARAQDAAAEGNRTAEGSGERAPEKDGRDAG